MLRISNAKALFHKYANEEPYPQITPEREYVGVEPTEEPTTPSPSMNVNEALKLFGYSSDNPGGEWLKGQRRLAADPEKGSGTITGYASGLPISVAKLDGVQGVNGEQVRFAEGENSEQYKYDREIIDGLKKSISMNGFDKKNGILLWIKYDGEVLVAEGNHRLQAARELGLKTIPTQIRWFAGSEMTEFGGEFSAEALASDQFNSQQM